MNWDKSCVSGVSRHMGVQLRYWRVGRAVGWLTGFRAGGDDVTGVSWCVHGKATPLLAAGSTSASRPRSTCRITGGGRLHRGQAYVGELAADDALLAPARGVDDAARLQAGGWARVRVSAVRCAGGG